MEEMNFDEMRNQFAILKQKLDDQEIVNDRLIRETIKVKTRDIDSASRDSYLAVVIVLLCLPIAIYTDVLSWPFVVATGLLMIFLTFATRYIHRPVDRLNLMTDDLATVARVMAKFKKQYSQWQTYVAPAIALPWLCWACYDFAWRNNQLDINPMVLCVPLFVGFVIGGIVGMISNRKAMNAAQSIIDQIEEKQ